MIGQLLTPTHVAILLVVLLLVFGPRRLPQVGRALGQSLHEFKQGVGQEVPRPDVTPGTETPSHRLHT